MARKFLDTSALVKLYVREPGSDWMLQLVEASQSAIHILSLARVELRGAVRRRQRNGDLAEPAAAAILDQFREDLATILVVQPVTEWIVEEAVTLLDRYPLRAYDALQLAGCLALRAAADDEDAPSFVCADLRLLEAARQEGLEAVDPANVPP